jgi:hypothetical protein
MNGAMIAFIALIGLHRPDGEQVSVNPRSVVTITPARDHGHFAPSVHCVVHLSDHKFLSVRETCDEVRHLFRKEG